MSHTTRSGVAVTVDVTAPALAEAVTGCHWAGSIHRKVARLTSWGMSPPGAMATLGDGSGVRLRACTASAPGLGGGGAAAGPPPPAGAGVPGSEGRSQPLATMVVSPVALSVRTSL